MSKIKYEYMKEALSPNTVSAVATALDEASDQELNAQLYSLWKQQPFLLAFTEAMLEVFEDQESFLDECHYYWLFIDKAYTAQYGTPAMIDGVTVDAALKNLELAWNELENSDDPGAFMETLIEEHPEQELLLYLFDTLFAAADELDDPSIDRLFQLFMYLFEMTSIYRLALVESKPD